MIMVWDAAWFFCPDYSLHLKNCLDCDLSDMTIFIRTISWETSICCDSDIQKLAAHMCSHSPSSGIMIKLQLGHWECAAGTHALLYPFVSWPFPPLFWFAIAIICSDIQIVPIVCPTSSSLPPNQNKIIWNGSFWFWFRTNYEPRITTSFLHTVKVTRDNFSEDECPHARWPVSATGSLLFSPIISWKV